MRLRSLIRRIVDPPIVLAAVLIVLLEEVVWRWVSRLTALLARIPLLAAAERLVDRLSPRLVAIVFAIPLSLVVPVYAVALWLELTGHVRLGILLLIAGKVLGTAVAARLFAVAKPKLLQVPSFAWIYRRVTRWIAFAHAYMARQPAWRATRAALQAVRGWLAAVRRRAARRGIAL